MIHELFKSNPQTQKREHRLNRTHKFIKTPKSPIRESLELKHGNLNIEPVNYLNLKFEQLS